MIGIKSHALSLCGRKSERLMPALTAVFSIKCFSLQVYLFQDTKAQVPESGLLLSSLAPRHTLPPLPWPPLSLFPFCTLLPTTYLLEGLWLCPVLDCHIHVSLCFMSHGMLLFYYLLITVNIYSVFYYVPGTILRAL